MLTLKRYFVSSIEWCVHREEEECGEWVVVVEGDSMDGDSDATSSSTET
jgi:hypothetical protein